MVILRKRVPGVNEASLDRFVARARRAVGLRGGVNVLITTNRELHALNSRFRGKHSPTDVLSFPSDSRIAPKQAGDIAISAEIAVHNARRLGHSGAEEIKILALHGVLHLAGYDHESDRGEMARLEERLRRKLRLPVALIERTVTPARHKTVTTAAPKKRTAKRLALHSRASRIPAKRRPAR
jgi:probable rRNA maturation factor